jgi:hypothetical protein
MATKLRQFLHLARNERLAYPAIGGARGGNIAIPILGLDPRVVLALSAWVTRATDNQGSSGDAADVASGITWSVYSAVTGADQNRRALAPLEGFQDRAIRSAAAWKADGVLCCGDSAEISASTDLLVVFHLADTTATLLLGVNQELWFSATAYPSDALSETASEEHKEAYHGLLEQIRLGMPSALAVNAAAPG